MGVLVCIAVGALVLAGCYTPEVRDCTVACASPRDCASGQVCGSDGMCAAPEVAGRCRAATDAGVRDDARDTNPDAGLPDGDPSVALHVQVMGKGSVLIDGIGTCSSRDPQHGNCMYDVVAGIPLIAYAIAIDTDDQFAMWASMTCAGESARCVFTPVAATTIAARFVHP